jgi:hypothetical protein
MADVPVTLRDQKTLQPAPLSVVGAANLAASKYRQR